MRFTGAWVLLWQLAAAAAIAAEVPKGTEIEIRLKTKVASNQSKAGDPVEAIVIVPVLVKGQILIPAGAALTGKVKKAQASSGTDLAMLELEFSELAGTGRKKTSIHSRVRSVDNARENIDDKGCILGIKASDTLSAQMDKGLEKLSEKVSQLAGLLQAAKGAFVKPADAEIAYEPGVDLTLQLTECVELDAPKQASVPFTAIASPAELEALVNAQPFQTMAEKPPQPSDVTNLMFIGTRQQVEAAFRAAGWNTAAVLNAASGVETVRAVVENRGYKEAPVSTLLLDGNKPDLVFQKQHNTFAKRHHLRIWQRAATFQGQPVWVSAATHDIGIEFSPENRTFIHKIDSQIDRERAKVVNDLLLSGRVKGLALVERPAVPKESHNATGDKLETDGAMAVLLFQ